MSVGKAEDASRQDREGRLPRLVWNEGLDAEHMLNSWFTRGKADVYTTTITHSLR
jgi:hypothetical protein